jgi:hypothetical protein
MEGLPLPQVAYKDTGPGRRATPWSNRRAAVEPVIGHLKDDHRMGRNYLAQAAGDAINAVLAAAGYNFRRLIAWLKLLLLAILSAIVKTYQLKLPDGHVLHGRPFPIREDRMRPCPFCRWLGRR